MSKLINLIGRRFGRWIVLSRDFTKRTSYWFCKCDCGTIKSVNGNNLRQGKTSSCGCIVIENLKKNRIQPNDINEIGNKYDRLTVVRKATVEECESNSRVYWYCSCSCGNFKSVRADSLRNGSIRSCGCLQSIGESEISKILRKNNVNFKRQVSFKGLTSILNSSIFFDFGVYNNENKLLFLIEFDGEQHFHFSNSGWNTEEQFEKTQFHDKLKNNYCKKENIPLIRIKYTEKINIEKILLEGLYKYGIF